MIRQVCFSFALLMGINNLIAADLMEDDDQDSIVFSSTRVNGKDDTSWRLFDLTVIDPNPSPDFCLIDPKSFEENVELVKTNMGALFEKLYTKVSTDKQFAYFLWVLRANLDFDSNKELKEKICLSLPKDESLYDYYEKSKKFKFSTAYLEYAMKQRITHNEQLKSLLSKSFPKKIVYTSGQVEASEETLIGSILMRIRKSLMPDVGQYIQPVNLPQASKPVLEPLVFSGTRVNGKKNVSWQLFDPYIRVDRKVPLLDPRNLKKVGSLKDDYLDGLVKLLQNSQIPDPAQQIAEIDQYIDVVFSSDQKRPYYLPSNKKQSLVEYVQLWKSAGYDNFLIRGPLEYAMTKCVMKNMSMRQQLSDTFARQLIYDGDNKQSIYINRKDISNFLMQIREKINQMDSAARQDKKNNFASWYTIYDIKNPGYILFNYDRVNGKQDSSWLEFDPSSVNLGGTQTLEDAMMQKINSNPKMKKQLIESYPQKIIYEVLETEGSEFNQVGKILMRIRGKIMNPVNSNPLKNVKKAFANVTKANHVVPPQSLYQRFLKIFTW